jgi:hypothetical protein
MMEFIRWTNYFFRANTALFIFGAIALFVTIKVIRQHRNDLPTIIALSLVAGFFGAAASMLLTDSHGLVPHVVPLAVLGYTGSIAILSAAHSHSILSAARLQQICCTILVVAALLNFAGAFLLQRQFSRAHYSNAAAEAFVLNFLPQRGDVKITAPTEIWPYLVKRRQPLLLVDHRAVFRHKGYVFDIRHDPEFAGTSYLFLNKEYHDAYGWEAMAEKWHQDDLVIKQAQIGDCKTQCLKSFALATAKGG